MGTRQLQYSGIDRPILPYKSYTSVIDTSAHFVPGSQNALILSDGMLRKRPGFNFRLLRSAVSNGTIKRIKTWERWDGTFFLIQSTTDGTNSYVFKTKWGTDLDPVLIHTSAGNPQPFDFVVSRNLLFFGNGVEMLKYDGTTVTKWGTNPPASAPTLAFTGATGATAFSTLGAVVASIIVTNAGSGYVSAPTVTLTGGGGSGATASASLSGSSITITLTAPGSGYVSPPTVVIGAPPVGGTQAAATATLAPSGVATVTVTNGGSGYNPASPPLITFSGGGGAGASATAVVSGTAVTSITITSPGTGYTSAPTVQINGGGISAFTGYFYGYTYVTQYGHESNMSPLSLSSGIFTGQIVTTSYVASTDAQVNGINIYRTTDGGSQAPDVMQLVNASPLANTSGTYSDDIADINLQLQVGPALLRNSPPTPCMGFVFWNNRIWGFAGGTTYFSGAEEIANGVAEEAWPAGQDGNFDQWPERVMGLGETPNQLGIGLTSQFWQKTGDTLDTFRTGLLLKQRGVRGITAIQSIGSDVVWQDRSRQLWTGSGGEIGIPIRPDLATVDPTQSYVGMHVQDSFNWIYCFDPANTKLYLFDLDMDVWNVPWTVQNACCIASGELTPGVVQLFMGFTDGFICAMNADAPGYLDDNQQYSEQLVTNLTSCSTGADATNRNRQEVGTPKQTEFETGPRLLDSISLLIDEDPTYVNANWRDQLAGSTDPSYQVPGTALVKKVYRATRDMQSANRAAMKFGFNASQTPWTVFSMALAWQVDI
jgi:hypothetical protein